MLNTYQYNTQQDVFRIVQITDPHLFKDTNGELLGINTQASFSQVLSEIQQQQYDYDLVLATGDLVQDNSDEGYLRFRQDVKALNNKMVFWIPGNHDFQPKMFEILKEETVSAKKHILLGDKWQILLLDSQVQGVPHGQLEAEELDWLKLKLQEYPERYSLVVLHHHLLSTGSAWLDQHNLRNANELAEVLAPFKHVKALLYGHIHQQVDSEWLGYQVMATPSTCIQFKADSNTFALDVAQPGWREIDLHADGHIETRVKRIQQASFLPNMQVEGY
ncbi:3',5'-cyclic-AMP phosphodiesterase [Aggregatibacter segnis]|uniref:3',5'-cyclic adenosine monophosphate phosphodiesterase CpdA n=1 Tax=Aggregatibacter segnis ATCC 33393 TaxID=888057 RepID=E6KWE7_9PAST|nr:3',5'-cyclic-AMP phosphodiesterase [Aggregatibacter segnis]EFU67828.1 3',5'-cyclic-nucleotide phosphodiesterase [Aggregatibacter segnis ATCC 33393]QQB09773.1 3',5'-cyclic-AMP phosphodiesterase [Aggregatibacter segnis]SQH64465.1 3',5'-cyclic adenosine monophosphate phosphodiesterase CpdA [Aggregatibacter segnis ATCC 33393]